MQCTTVRRGGQTAPEHSQAMRSGSRTRRRFRRPALRPPGPGARTPGPPLSAPPPAITSPLYCCSSHGKAPPSGNRSSPWPSSRLNTLLSVTPRCPVPTSRSSTQPHLRPTGLTKPGAAVKVIGDAACAGRRSFSWSHLKSGLAASARALQSHRGWAPATRRSGTPPVPSPASQTLPNRGRPGNSAHEGRNRDAGPVVGREGMVPGPGLGSPARSGF